jgi:ABC-2 type transport system permease protein
MHSASQLAGLAPRRREISLLRSRIVRRLQAISSRRELLLELARKDFDTRYAGSILGVFWTQLYPLLLLLVYSFVFSVIFKNNIPHFPLFLFTGIALWSFFSTSILLSTGAILANQGLIVKVGFPRELLVLSVIIMALVDLAASHVILIAGALWYGVSPSLSWLLLPVIILLLTIFAAGLGLILSTAAVYLRDVRFFTEVAVLMLMFLTPVFYTPAAVPDGFGWLLSVNPLASFVIAYRDVFLDGVAPALDTWLVLVVSAALSLVLGMEIFDRGQRGFPDAL